MINKGRTWRGVSEGPQPQAEKKNKIKAINIDILLKYFLYIINLTLKNIKPILIAQFCVHPSLSTASSIFFHYTTENIAREYPRTGDSSPRRFRVCTICYDLI